MTNEQKAYINKLINHYEYMSNMFGDASREAKKAGNEEQYSLWLEKQVIYYRMKSDLEKILKI